MSKVWKLVVIALATPIASASFAHTLAETNAVLAVMLGRAFDRISFDDYTHGGPSDWIYESRTQQGFFSVWSNESWTVEEKMGAFDYYLDSLSRANRSVTNELFRYASVAFIQCDAMSYTNAVPVLRRAAVNPYLSKVLYRSSAIEAAVRMGGVSDEATDFVEYIMTNSSCFFRSEISDATFKYARMLENAPESSSVGRAVRMYYRNRMNWRFSHSVDRLFVRKITGYAASSNRLAYLSWALSNVPDQDQQWDRRRVEMRNVTNQLMQASQPLPEVESLSGIETMPAWSDSYSPQPRLNW